MIIDAKNLIAGRLAAFVAKHALSGEKIIIINSEKAVISGRKKEVLAKYKRKVGMGVPKKGPFQPRMPDRFLKKIIKGMLPMTKPRGREALKRVKCYINVPEEFKKEKPENITESMKNMGADKLPTLKKVSIARICEYLGGKWHRHKQEPGEKKEENPKEQEEKKEKKEKKEKPESEEKQKEEKLKQEELKEKSEENKSEKS